MFIHALRSRYWYQTDLYTQTLHVTFVCAYVRACAFPGLNVARWCYSVKTININTDVFNDTRCACLTRRVKLGELSGSGVLRSPARRGAARSRPMFIPVRILLCHRPMHDLRLWQQHRSHAPLWWPVFRGNALITTLYRAFSNWYTEWHTFEVPTSVKHTRN